MMQCIFFFFFHFAVNLLLDLDLLEFNILYHIFSSSSRVYMSSSQLTPMKIYFILRVSYDRARYS